MRVCEGAKNIMASSSLRNKFKKIDKQVVHKASAFFSDLVQSSLVRAKLAVRLPNGHEASLDGGQDIESNALLKLLVREILRSPTPPPASPPPTPADSGVAWAV